MSALNGPWMYSSEEDVTTMGLVTPEYQEMALEAQGVETEEKSEGPESAIMQQALQTMQQQSAVIQSLVELLKG
jgi:hypothetical protein